MTDGFFFMYIRKFGNCNIFIFFIIVLSVKSNYFSLINFYRLSTDENFSVNFYV